jgi:hypothetical protein
LIIVVDHQSVSSQSVSGFSEELLPIWIDPVLLKAARALYQEYCEAHTQQTDVPLGVTIDPKTGRGQVIVSRKPVLLPMEHFFPIEYVAARPG